MISKLVSLALTITLVIVGVGCRHVSGGNSEAPPKTQAIMRRWTRNGETTKYPASFKSYHVYAGRHCVLVDPGNATPYIIPIEILADPDVDFLRETQPDGFPENFTVPPPSPNSERRR